MQIRFRTFFFLILLVTASSNFTFSQKNTNNGFEVNPLDLKFQRLAVRRFIFSNNINLNEFIPSEIVNFKSMYPAFVPSTAEEPANDVSFRSKIENGKLLLDASCGKNNACIYMGGVNPYATYEMTVASFSSAGADSQEVGLEFAEMGLKNRIQVVSKLAGSDIGVSLRFIKDGNLAKEVELPAVFSSNGFSLKVQLYGRTLGVFLTQNGETKYVGQVPVKEDFTDILDFRRPDVTGNCSYNLISNLKGKIFIEKVQSYLSPGVGQADIRLISNEDLSPYWENNRLWFTFSCRGFDTPQSVQGVLSFDPSVFDIKFEGMIVFDHGDGYLRNDYASHLFYDRKSKEWKAYACDFGGSENMEKRSKTGLITASSTHDPRKGFSIMKAARVEFNSVDGHNEDPCIYFDEQDQKWKLLTCAFVNGDITSRTFESDTWNGKFKPLATPIATNSTGTSIQIIGTKHYALMGGKGNLRVHSFPDLKELGELKLNLQPHWPNPAGRVWASVVPLPAGFPYRYILLTMDRANYPDAKGPNWSYGALYFYGANTPNIMDENYEF